MTALKIALGTLFLAGIVLYTSKQAQYQLNAVDSYEKCVQDRSGHTPAYIYQETGHYPECY